MNSEFEVTYPYYTDKSEACVYDENIILYSFSMDVAHVLDVIQ